MLCSEPGHCSPSTGPSMSWGRGTSNAADPVGPGGGDNAALKYTGQEMWLEAFVLWRGNKVSTQICHSFLPPPPFAYAHNNVEVVEVKWIDLIFVSLSWCSTSRSTKKRKDMRLEWFLKFWTTEPWFLASLWGASGPVLLLLFVCFSFFEVKCFKKPAGHSGWF